MSFLGPANKASQIVNNGSIGFLNQIRTATKRAAGSRTNKNDSAGRRLGPKAYENHFVQPGQIIMRQRGTKVHPGENVGIGNDHTIFALEPGYVRFYMDPFHPLRKYVGVALKKELSLPTPHFDPRVRRFGYIQLHGAEAEKEEGHMSRKEYLAQPQLQLRAQNEAEATAAAIKIYENIISKSSEFSAQQVQFGASRLQFIASKLKAGENAELSGEQATFNFVFDLELAAARGDISANEFASQSEAYMSFAGDFDRKFAVDFAGKVYTPMSVDERNAAQASVKGKLEELKNKILSSDEKQTVRKLIGTPGLFSHGEQLELKETYLPEVLPVSVPGTVVTGKKLPKGAVTVRTFDEEKRSVETIVRSKEAFA